MSSRTEPEHHDARRDASRTPAANKAASGEPPRRPALPVPASPQRSGPSGPRTSARRRAGPSEDLYPPKRTLRVIANVKHKDSSKPFASAKSTTSWPAVKQGRQSSAYDYSKLWQRVDFLLQFFLRTSRNRFPIRQKFALLISKENFTEFGIRSVSATIGINWSIFYVVGCDSVVGSVVRKTVSPRRSVPNWKQQTPLLTRASHPHRAPITGRQTNGKPPSPNIGRKTQVAFLPFWYR